ncbi:MAG: ABC transporter substrate-binding protein [Rhodospirillaceae bacterium]|nr:ABC transporter substrate-binding protein [Rhodospirillaceae bacterium]
MLKRRDFLAGAGAGAIAGSGAAKAARAAPAVSSGHFEWKMLTAWPKNFPGAGTGAQRIADRIETMSDGRLKIRLFAAGELVPAFELFDAVREGNAECGHSASYYWLNKHKATAFFCALPGGLTATEHNAWIYFGGGLDLWHELYGQFGLIAFPAGGTGVQMGGWFRKEINSLADMKGLKMRMPGLAAEVLNRLGATAVNMPAGEIMPSLQSGVIDATEWIGPWNDLALGFYKVAPYYYGPGFHEGNSAQELMINRAAWEALPADLQAIVRGAAEMENLGIVTEYVANNADALKVLVEKHKVKVGALPDDVMKESFRISADVVAEVADIDDIGRRIYESWSKFRNDAVGYAPLADYGFSRGRAL